MGEGYENVHICRGPEQRYLARVRRPGHRLYECLGEPRMTRLEALTALVEEFAKGHYKRGDVLSVAANPLDDWYGPHTLDEIVKVG